MGIFHLARKILHGVIARCGAARFARFLPQNCSRLLSTGEHNRETRREEQWQQRAAQKIPRPSTRSGALEREIHVKRLRLPLRGEEKKQATRYPQGIQHKKSYLPGDMRTLPKTRTSSVHAWRLTSVSERVARMDDISSRLVRGRREVSCEGSRTE